MKVRRGLSTNNDAEADQYVAQLNEILANERYWSLSSKLEAEQRFARVVVDAFYSGLEVATEHPLQIRENSIPLPSAREGYARVLLVGTTGAGKTTLLRHFIGSHPRTDRFPSTSTGKTTVADLELVTADGPFSGIVTFLPERVVRGYLQENLSAASLAAWRGEDDAEIARQFLQHPDQKFRLNYVLGSWNDADDGEDWGFDEDGAVDDGSGESEESASPTEQERRDNQRLLEEWIVRIRTLAAQTGGGVTQLLSIDWETLKGGDLDAAEEVFSEALEDSAGFDELISEVFDAILRRFNYLEAGQLTRTSTSWPVKWELTLDDREQFLTAVRWFSSNFAPRYGRLLTPLVQGMRVRGPLFPSGILREPRLVLIDGQGLGTRRTLHQA